MSVRRSCRSCSSAVLARLSLGDVSARFHDAGHFARFVEHRRCTDLDEHLPVVGIVVGVSHRHWGLARDDLLQRAGLILPLAGKVAVVRQAMTRHADRGIDSSAHFAGDTVGQQNAIVAANNQHGVGDRVDHRLQKDL